MNTSLICDFCWTGKPAQVVIVRHPVSDRGSRKQACDECVDKMRQDDYTVRVPK